MTLDYSIPDWRTPHHRDAALVSHRLADGSSPFPKSDADDFIDMTVYRLPLNQMDVAGRMPCPEIRSEHHTAAL